MLGSGRACGGVHQKRHTVLGHAVLVEVAARGVALHTAPRAAAAATAAAATAGAGAGEVGHADLEDGGGGVAEHSRVDRERPEEEPLAACRERERRVEGRAALGVPRDAARRRHPVRRGAACRRAVDRVRVGHPWQRGEHGAARRIAHEVVHGAGEGARERGAAVGGRPDAAVVAVEVVRARRHQKGVARADDERGDVVLRGKGAHRPRFAAVARDHHAGPVAPVGDQPVVPHLGARGSAAAGDDGRAVRFHGRYRSARDRLAVENLPPVRPLRVDVDRFPDSAVGRGQEPRRPVVDLHHGLRGPSRLEVERVVKVGVAAGAGELPRCGERLWFHRVARRRRRERRRGRRREAAGEGGEGAEHQEGSVRAGDDDVVGRADVAVGVGAR